MDSAVDGVKLTANNKPNVCAAVQRAYDRARQQHTAITTAISAASEPVVSSDVVTSQQPVTTQTSVAAGAEHTDMTSGDDTTS